MERWSSGFGFLLAAVGAAVGLGNIWRFSAVVGQNGGGAYLVPYLVAAFAFAVPLMILEISVGRRLRTDVVGAFESVRPSFGALGWTITASVLLILSYYLVLTGWVLAFFVSAMVGTTPSFAGFTSSYWPLLYFLVATVLTGGIVASGVRSGIERMSKVVMPVVVAVLVGLVVYATTLSGFGEGVEFLFTPDVSVLADPLVWSAAFGQVFFSLSVGQGIMLTYGSYLGEETDVVRASLYITVADIGVAVLSGLVIFPVVFSFGLEPTLGTELAFTTLPQAFASMRMGGVVAVAFFGLLFFAAISSSVGLLEVGVAAVTRRTGRPRRRVATAMTGAVFLAGVPSALSYTAFDLRVSGIRVLDLLDESVGTFALPVSAVLIAVAFTWYLDPSDLRSAVGDSVVVPVAKYAIPVVLVVVTGLRTLTGFRVGRWPVTGRGIVDGLRRFEVAVVALLVLLGLGWALVRYLPRRRNRRGRTEYSGGDGPKR